MIYDMLQGSVQWDRIRAGRLTASECGEWVMAQPKLTLKGEEIKAALDDHGIVYKKTMRVGDLAALLPPKVVAANQGYLVGETKVRHQTMCRMLGRELSRDTPDPDSWTGNGFTDYGHAFEPAACTSFEIETGMETRLVGFVDLDEYPYMGCSPDRLVYNASGHFMGPLEVKCRPVEHAQMVIDGVLPSEYRLQCHFQMVLCGTTRGYFYGYSPDMLPILIEIKADSLTHLLSDSLRKFHADYAAFRTANLPKLK
tara:strand:- start:2453 stop:3217 length:765 start_codon:yes stop_codon:yes gene_type:complete